MSKSVPPGKQLVTTPSSTMLTPQRDSLAEHQTAPPTTTSALKSQRQHTLPPDTNGLEQREKMRQKARWLVCFACAVVVHLGASLLNTDGSAPHSAGAAERAPELSTFLDVAVELPAPAEGLAPGGGSLEPEPDAAEEALPERLEPTPPKAAAPEPPVAAPAPEEHQDTRLADVAPETEPDPEAAPASGLDLLAEPAVDIEGLPDTVRPAAIRNRTLTPAKRPSATAPVVARSDAQKSRHYGLGPGRGGGPGGKGSGWGNGNGNVVIKQKFAFGGPTGAFRADVCFIHEGTSSLASITRCPREATFYTDILDVSPRRFNAGFPGVSTRSEWFAIRYRGKFTIRASGQYYFRLLSDDGSKLYIDGFMIIDNDGTHPPSARHGNMRLMAGEHELFVSYFQGPRDNIALQLFVTPPGGEEQILTPHF